MSGQQQSRTDSHIWHVPGQTPVVLHAPGVCERIVSAAFDTLRRTSGIGETGGILFGSADDAEVKITASRPLRLDSAGPFLLDAGGHELMQQLIQTTATEPELRKLVPVGCYRVRVGGDLALGENDIELWNRHFPFRWQIMMLLRIEEGQPVRGGFFFRPVKGTPKTDAPFAEFELEPPAPPRSGSDLLPVLLPRDLFRIPAERGPGRAKWYAMGALAALAAMAAGYQYGRNRPVAAPAVEDAGLRLAEKDGFLTAEWNASSPVLRQLRDGRLLIADGNRQTDMALTDPMLATASWSIRRSTEDVRVRIAGKTPANEPFVVQSARFVGPVIAPPQEAPAEETPAQIAAMRRARNELARAQAALERQLKANGRHEQNLERVQKALEARLAAASPEPAAAADPPRERPTEPTTAKTQPPPAVQPAPASQPPQPPPVQPPPAQTTVAPQPVTGPPVQVTEPEPVRYSGPASGRIIWTGYLPANATLTIDGKKASAGSLSSSLPAVETRVTVHAAEFNSSGVTLFTASAARANTTEARSARTGWMTATFVLDPARAQDARLAAAPSTAHPQRVVIRSGERPLSAVVIDWQVR